MFATRELTLHEQDCAENLFAIAPGRYLELRVEDTGTGISPDIMERIFDPFFTTKAQGKGTGLGLAAVFGTVQQHDGSVTVESEMGQGTTFVVRLPLAQQSASKSSASDSPISGEGVVLVVDDEEFLRKTTTKTLQELGYETLTANDGVEAVELFDRKKEQIDAILLDMSMPRMNGRDCLVELRGLAPNVPIVATSGFLSPEDLENIRSLGIAEHLPKPYHRNELSKAVCNAIHQCG